MSITSTDWMTLSGVTAIPAVGALLCWFLPRLRAWFRSHRPDVMMPAQRILPDPGDYTRDGGSPSPPVTPTLASPPRVLHPTAESWDEPTLVVGSLSTNNRRLSLRSANVSR